jgi:hypothetical protein
VQRWARGPRHRRRHRPERAAALTRPVAREHFVGRGHVGVLVVTDYTMLTRKTYRSHLKHLDPRQDGVAPAVERGDDSGSGQAGERAVVRAEPAPRAGAAAIPRCLRVSWWVLMVCDGIFAADVIAAARLFDRPLIYLSLIGPGFLGSTLALIAWWHTRGPGRRLWS